MKKKSCPCCLVMRNFTNGFCEYCGMPVEWLTAYQELKECQISLQCPDGKLRWFHSSLFEHGYAGVFEKLRKHCRVCDKCE